MFSFLIGLVVAAAFAVAAILLMPKPEMQNAKAASLNDFNFPTNDNSRAIPELFGTAKLSGNILWYGDLRSSELKT